MHVNTSVASIHCSVPTTHKNEAPRLELIVFVILGWRQKRPIALRASLRFRRRLPPGWGCWPRQSLRWVAIGDRGGIPTTFVKRITVWAIQGIGVISRIRHGSLLIYFALLYHIVTV